MKCLQTYLFSFLNPGLLVSPLLLLVSSITGLASSVLGVSLVIRRGRRLLTLHGLTSVLALSLTLAGLLSAAILVSGSTTTDLETFAQNTSVLQEENVTRSLEMWEVVQEQYQCCGVIGESGYEDWLPLLPDSCCTIKYPHCGRDALATLNSDFANTFYDRIFPTGCLTVFR